jgi:hypothetical protein
MRRIRGAALVLMTPRGCPPADRGTRRAGRAGGRLLPIVCRRRTGRAAGSVRMIALAASVRTSVDAASGRGLAANHAPSWLAWAGLMASRAASPPGLLATRSAVSPCQLYRACRAGLDSDMYIRNESDSV